MEFFRKIKIAMLIVLLPAMLALTGNAIFNLHIHKQEGGNSFIHAHPMEDSETQSGATHSHSSSDCISIQQITSLIFIVIVSVFLNLITTKQIKHNQLEFSFAIFKFSPKPLNNSPPYLSILF